MNNNGKWTFSSNEEFFCYGEYFETKEEAAEAGIEYFDDDGFYIGQVEEVGAGVLVDVNAILELINESMCDEVGSEVANDYLMDTKKEHDDELENELCDVIAKWIKKHGYGPTFFKVVNIEKVELSEERA